MQFTYYRVRPDRSYSAFTAGYIPLSHCTGSGSDNGCAWSHEGPDTVVRCGAGVSIETAIARIFG